MSKRSAAVISVMACLAFTACSESSRFQPSNRADAASETGWDGQDESSAARDADEESSTGPDTGSGSAEDTLVRAKRDEAESLGMTPCPATVEVTGMYEQSLKTEGFVGVDGIPFEDYVVFYGLATTDPTGFHVFDYEISAYANGMYAVAVRGTVDDVAYGWQQSFSSEADLPFAVPAPDGSGATVKGIELEGYDGSGNLGGTIRLDLSFDCA